MATNTCDASVDIAIVGGGLSGLMVALLLEELNLGSWVLLEANSERFGGRLMNTPSGVDVGAAWIFYGQRKMLDLSKKLGVKTFPQPGDPTTSRVTGGTVALPLAIASRLPASSLRKDFEVVSCTQDPSSSPAITLTSSSGSSIAASRVVFAVPPKLIHDRISFTPALPADKTRAMSVAHTWMAGVTKVVIEFSDKFWPDGATDTGLPRSGPGFQVYDGSTDDVTAVTFFAMVPAGMDDSTAGKQCAAQLAQVWSMQGLGAEAQRLRDFHKDSKSKVTVHRWPKERFTSVEQDPTTIHPHPHPVRVLGRREWEGALHFASSEADWESPGLMEGAVGAAQRVVSEIKGAK